MIQFVKAWDCWYQLPLPVTLDWQTDLGTLMSEYLFSLSGIALSAGQWNKLKSLVSDIDEVIQEMS